MGVEEEADEGSRANQLRHLPRGRSLKRHQNGWLGRIDHPDGGSRDSP